ncbi:MAG: hypothetical protein SH850_03560, partial [Planctomycetaceae bacterium]|nr:hypothetical protein [Planctomycetaceae bacterium]
ELPGLFRTGVPGILARVEDGRLVPGAKVERCDLCQRYPSDEAALARLQELGIPVSPEDAESYTVHGWVTVRVTYREVVAPSPRQAAEWAQAHFCWADVGRQAECDEGLHEFLVDVVGDPDYSQSMRFNADLEEIVGAAPSDEGA